MYIVTVQINFFIFIELLNVNQVEIKKHYTVIIIFFFFILTQRSIKMDKKNMFFLSFFYQSFKNNNYLSLELSCEGEGIGVRFPSSENIKTRMH